jgi:hypothetical protein
MFYRLPYRLIPAGAAAIAVLCTVTACGTPAASSASSPQQPSSASAAAASSGPAPAAPGSASAAVTTPATIPPAAGTTLLQQSSLDGAVGVISNGVGFSVIQDLLDNAYHEIGNITAYDAAGQSEAKITGVNTACGAADVVLPSQRRVILAENMTSTPAQGVNPATSTTTLEEFDAATGARLWSTILVSGPASDGPSGCNSDGRPGQLEGFTSTTDGAYAVDQDAPSDIAWIIDLTTGSKRSSKTALQALGGVVLDGTNVLNSDGDTTQTISSFSAPATGARVGAPPGVDDPKELTNGAGYATDSEYVYSLGNDGMEALSLPSGKLLWSVKNAPVDDSDVSVVGTDVIAWNHFEDSTGLAGYTLGSGSFLWSQPSAQFCGAARGKVLIAVNDQLAVLSAATGKQLSFDPSTGECPNILPNGITWSSDNGSLVVTQYL